MNDIFLHPDTQAILLLCSYLGLPSSQAPKPLTPGEYNRFAFWLNQQKMRPSDLMDPAESGIISKFEDKNVSPQRINDLLGRGGAMGFILEEWKSRNIWIIGRCEDRYPARLKERLKSASPPIIYGVGNIDSLNRGGFAIVGSRKADEEGLEFTRRVAQVCAGQNLVVISGGAKGVDQEALFSALGEKGNVIAVLADGFSKSAISKKYRDYLRSGEICLITPYDPDAGFSVGNAMGRNKIIYALADYALVISSDREKGGTWAGATENIQKKWTPLFIYKHDDMPEGNRCLIEKNGIPIDRDALSPESKFTEWLKTEAEKNKESLEKTKEKDEPSLDQKKKVKKKAEKDNGEKAEQLEFEF